ncbi:MULTISPECIES: PIN-like domain-containing protein [Bacillaceae]
MTGVWAYVLLNFYKYTTKESTKSLLDILKKLKDDERLWVPHQVALELF